MIRLFGRAKGKESLLVDLVGKEVMVEVPPSLYEGCLFVPVVRALGGVCRGLVLVSPESMAGFWGKAAPDVALAMYRDEAGAKGIAQMLKGGGFHGEVSLAWIDAPVAEAFARHKVATRVGYDGVGLRKWLTEALRHEDEPGRHQVHFYLDLLKGMGLEAFTAANFQTPLLPARGVRPRVALVPGSELGTAFKWPVERFAEVAERILGGCDAELVVLSLPSMVIEAEELARRLEGRAQNFAGQFDVPGLMDAIPYCSLMIANDGSLPLLAGLAGVPAVVMYGPSDPTEAAPFGNQHALLTVNAACSPCNQMGCLYDHHECMRELTVEQVLQAAAGYLLPAG